MAKTLGTGPELPAPPDGQEMLGRMVRQGGRLRDMVEQILQASAFAADRSPVMANQMVALADLVHVAASARRAPDPSHPILVSLPSLPRAVWRDIEALRSVLG